MNDRQIIEAAVTILPLLHDLLGTRAADVIRRLAWWLAPERTGTAQAASEALAILAENPETRRWLREYLPENAEAMKSLFPAPVPPAPVFVPLAPVPLQEAGAGPVGEGGAESTSLKSPRRPKNIR